MGLETINYSFRASDIVNSLRLLSELMPIEFNGSKYVEIKDANFWIDIEIINDSEIQIRVALCNDRTHLFKKLFHLFELLLSYSESGVLKDFHSGLVWTKYSQQLKDEVINTYELRKSNFERMYGDYTAAISSGMFNKLKHTLRRSSS